MFTCGPFGDATESYAVGRKLEFVAIRQFADFYYCGPQRGTEFIKMTLPVGGRQSRTVAGERGLLSDGLAPCERECAEHQRGTNRNSGFLHSYTLRVEVELKSRGRTCKTSRAPRATFINRRRGKDP